MVDKKRALITGANKSIGYEVARRLLEMDHIVWLGCRDEERGHSAVERLRVLGGEVHVLTIDVADDESVLQAATALAGETDRLDVLVNNAGISGSFYGSPLEQPMESIKATYEVNVFGPIRVTQAFAPLLKAAPAARIVMVSSELGSIAAAVNPEHEFYPYNFLGYNSSKTALNAVTVSFAKALMDTDIKVNAADPGYTATDFNGHSGYRTVEEAAEIIVKLATLDSQGPTSGYFNHNGVVEW